MQIYAFETLAAHCVRRIFKPPLRLARIVSCLLLLATPPATWADFEASAPDGRRVILRDDGTWKYLEPNKDQAKEQPAGEAILELVRKTERGAHCRVVLQLTNKLPFEIAHLVPYFSAYRANSGVHETVSVAFQSIRPSDTLERSADFSRITCAEIARIQVSGGDRCQMGELSKFSDANGQCLARVRIVPANSLRFDK